MTKKCKKRNASQVGKLSRRKGKAFENQIARMFTKATGIKWESTRNSGRTDLRGDVWSPELKREPFIIECKHRANLQLEQMMKNTKALREIMDKAHEETVPSVIIIKNNAGIWFNIEQINFNHTSHFKSFFNGETEWFELNSLNVIGYLSDSDFIDFEWD